MIIATSSSYRAEGENESGFKLLLCTYRLNWARRTPWGWWDESSIVPSSRPAFLYQNRPKRYCVLKGHNYPPPPPLGCDWWNPPPPLGHAPFGWLIRAPPPLLGKDGSSRSPHPFLERVTHHCPLRGSPSPWCLLQSGTSPSPWVCRGSPSPRKGWLITAFHLPQKRMTHHCPIFPPLGVCHRLVQPVPLAPQEVPLPLVSVTDWYDPHLCNGDDI